IAKELGLLVYNKPDSQEICFVKDNDYVNYVKKHTTKTIKQGNFVDKNGKVLGKHQGIINYTIGQRKGLGITFGKPMFVVEINAKNNTVVLGDNEDLFTKEVIAKDVNLITIDKVDKPMRVQAKIRYSAKPSDATLYGIEEKNSISNDGNINTNYKIKLVFDEPQRAITPGQSVVIYDGDVVVGGGIITK
ncbi:MAG: tRNA 2-thiouridine(34) synthase MnmA, partial [Clostridioides sp.]|nr:tRNA 2-thiouridine(34) synthase MnmA [Clostridioides sp.]